MRRDGGVEVRIDFGRLVECPKRSSACGRARKVYILPCASSKRVRGAIDVITMSEHIVSSIYSGEQ